MPVKEDKMSQMHIQKAVVNNIGNNVTLQKGVLFKCQFFTYFNFSIYFTFTF